MTISLLKDKRIVLGVSGSIACYKTIDLASKLTQAGALVDVIMTKSAQQFVTPLTFQAVTGRTVYSDLWNADGHVAHVKLGESADLFLVSPATAHTVGKLANGLADNMLTVTALTARCPIVVAPAMDGGMYANSAMVDNIARLRNRGVLVIEPKEGRMASGLVGKGRLPETAEMLGHIRLALGSDGTLAGSRVLVTAGPTRERFDPVRFISNRSTGKQGVALAQAALDAGAQVTLVTGPIAQPIPVGAEHVQIESAQQLHDAVLAKVGESNILMMAAAVGDFRPKTTTDHKIKKDPNATTAPTIELARTPDILSAVKAWKAEAKQSLFVLGFAAETNDIVTNGQSKLERKGLDMIAVNDVGGSATGFGVDTNQIVLLSKSQEPYTISLRSKAQIAEAVVDHVAEQLNAND